MYLILFKTLSHYLFYGVISNSLALLRTANVYFWVKRWTIQIKWQQIFSMRGRSHPRIHSNLISHRTYQLWTPASTSSGNFQTKGPNFTPKHPLQDISYAYHKVLKLYLLHKPGMDLNNEIIRILFCPVVYMIEIKIGLINIHVFTCVCLKCQYWVQCHLSDVNRIK